MSTSNYKNNSYNSTPLNSKPTFISPTNQPITYRKVQPTTTKNTRPTDTKSAITSARKPTVYSSLNEFELDKMKTIKKINIALDSLDTLTEDKKQLMNRIMQQEHQIDEINEKIQNSEQCTNELNSDMQSQIIEQKASNQIISDQLELLNKDRSSVAVLQTKLSEEILQIKTDITYRTTQIKQKDESMQQLQIQLDIHKKEHEQLSLEYKELTQDTEQKEATKKLLLEKLTLLNDNWRAQTLKFSQDDQTYTHDIYQLDQVYWLTKNDQINATKKLKARLLAITITQYNHKLQANAFNLILSSYSKKYRINKAVREIVINITRINKVSLHYGFTKWKKTCIWWNSQVVIKNHAIQAYQSKQQEITQANVISSKTQSLMLQRNDKISSVSSMQSVLAGILKRTTYSIYSNIKMSCRNNLKKKLLLARIAYNRRKSHLKYCYSRIKYNHIKSKDTQKLYAISQLLTDTKHLQSAFFQFRAGIRHIKNTKHIQLNSTLRTWKLQKYKQELKTRAAMIAIEMSISRSKSVLQNNFNIIRQYYYQTKQQKTKKQLMELIEAKIQNKNIQHTTQTEHNTRQVLKLIRNIASQGHDKIHSYIYQWKLLTDLHKIAVFHLRTIVGKKIKRCMQIAFNEWVAGVILSYSIGTLTTIRKIEDRQDNIINANNDLHNLFIQKKRERKQYETRKGKRCSHKINNTFLRTKLYRWIAHSFIIANKRSSILKMEAIRNHIDTRIALNKYKLQSKLIRQLLCMNAKLNAFKFASLSRTKRRHFHAISKYARRYKIAKLAFVSALKTFTRAVQRRRIRIWSNTYSQYDVSTLKVNIAKLEQSIADKEITQNSLTNERSTIDETVDIKQKQNKLRNTRFIFIRINKTFNEYKLHHMRRWMSSIRNTDASSRILCKYVHLLLKNTTHLYFTHWLRQSNHLIINQKRGVLREITNKEQIINDECRTKDNEATILISHKMNGTNKLAKTGEYRKNIYNNILNKLLMDSSINAYYSLKGECFREFRKVVSKQKSLMLKVLKNSETISKVKIVVVLKNAFLNRSKTNSKIQILSRFIKSISSSNLRSLVNKWKLFAIQEMNKIYFNQNESITTNRLYKLKFIKSKKSRYLNSTIQTYKETKKRQQFSNYHKQLEEAFLYKKQTVDAANLITLHRKNTFAYQFIYNCRYKINIRTRDAMISNKHQAKQLSYSYKAWKAMHKTVTRFTKIILKVFHSEASSSLNIFTKLNKDKNNYQLSRKHIIDIAKANAIAYTVKCIYSLNVISTLKRIKQLVEEKHHTQAKVRQILAHMPNLRFKSAFYTFIHNCQIEMLEKSSVVVKSKIKKQNELKAKIAKCEEILKKDGHSTITIKNKLEKEVNLNDSAIGYTINRWTNYNRKDYSIVLTLDRWKQYAIKRKLISRYLSSINRYIEKSPNTVLSNTLFTWKKIVNQPVESMLRTKKKDILKQVVSSNKAMEQKQQIFEEVSQKQDNIQKKIHSAEHKTSDAKMYALTYIIRMNKLRFKSSLLKWQSQAIRVTIGTHNKKIYQNETAQLKYSEKSKYYDDHNKTLATENEDFRMASLESVELAKSAAFLKCQFAEHSMDLADRAHEIYKVLIDNMQYKDKFRQARSEAAKVVTIQSATSQQ